jgi:hypothetical protein
MPSSDGYEAFVSAVLGKGFPFMAAVGLQRSLNQPRIWCRQHGAQQWSAREASATSARLPKKMAEWRHGAVRSRHGNEWGSTVRRIDRAGKKNEKNLGH